MQTLDIPRLYLESPASLTLSGQRFTALYSIAGNEAEAREKALALCIEQTVEFPADLLPDGDIRDQVVGRIEWLDAVSSDYCLVGISFAVETTGYELTQLLNVLFGNTSLQPGVRLERFDLPDSLLKSFRGPQFGREGLRRHLGVFDRPLLSTALKPMGLSAVELAELAYQFALGGIDIIKDDHGLSNQPFAPFKERLERCAEAVARANRQTGLNCIYVPNISGPLSNLSGRAAAAKAAGAGGLMIAPGLMGFEAMRLLADDRTLNLPILAHPALLGSFVVSAGNGISHFALFGQIARLAGADAVIFPNYGGRFSFSQDDCRAIADGTTVRMGPIRPTFPAPGGGMSLGSIPAMLDLYGRDVILLIGGDLYRRGPNLIENSRNFMNAIASR